MDTSKPKRKKEITISDIKKCKGFEKLTDEEANEVIHDLETIVRIAIEIMKHNKDL